MKIYTVRYYRINPCAAPPDIVDYRGTIDYLNNDVFGYTLDCGSYRNKTIPRYPKTGKSLVNALTKTAADRNNNNVKYELVA